MGALSSLGLDNINYLSAFSNIIYWVFYGLLALGLLLLFVAVYYYLSFRIKVDVYPMYGSGKDGVLSIGKRKTNRVKWNRDKTAWKKLWPLMNRKTIEPFDDEYFYPGQRIIAFELNQQWFPGRVNINKDEKGIRGEINPVPYWVRNWQSIEHKQNSLEFSKHDFWNDNKFYIWMVIAIGLCVGMTLVTIWLSYKFSSGGVSATDRLTLAIQNLGGASAGRPAG